MIPIFRESDVGEDMKPNTSTTTTEAFNNVKNGNCLYLLFIAGI